MPTIDQYQKSDAFIRLLLQGPPGAGKTTLACQFPGVWFLDCDINLAGSLRWLNETKKPLPIGYDIIDRTEDDKPVPENMRYARLVKCANEASGKPGVQTLVFDSATKIMEYIKAHVLRTQPTKTGQLGIPSWGFIYSEWLRLVGTVTAAKLNCVFIFHEKDVVSEDGSLVKVGINVQGQFQHIAGSLFTDVWRLEVENKGGLLAPNYVRRLRTMPDHRYQLKNSFGLPPMFEFDWSVIEGKLKNG